MPQLEHPLPESKRLVGKIDYDRGAVIRISRDGMSPEVVMYKDDPGVYYAKNGRRIGIEAARRAGFDVDHNEKLRKRGLYQKHALEQWDLVNKSMESVRKVVFEKGDYRVVDLGLSRHVIEDSDGFLLTPGSHLSLEEAKQTLELFLPVPDETVETVRDMGMGDGGGPRGRAEPAPPRSFKRDKALAGE